MCCSVLKHLIDTFINMYSTTGTSGLVHKSGTTVAEWRSWQLRGAISTPGSWADLRTKGLTRTLHQSLNHRWTPAGFIYSNRATMGSAVRPASEAATTAWAAANNPKQTPWAVLSRVFRPYATAIYTQLRLADTLRYYLRAETSGCTQTAHVWSALQGKRLFLCVYQRV